MADNVFDGGAYRPAAPAAEPTARAFIGGEPVTVEPAPSTEPDPAAPQAPAAPDPAAHPFAEDAGWQEFGRISDDDLMAPLTRHDPGKAALLRDDWAGDFRQNAFLAGRVMSSYADTGLGQAIAAAGLDTDPDTWRAAAKIGQRLARDPANPLRLGTGPAAQQGAKDELAALQAEEAKRYGTQEWNDPAFQRRRNEVRGRALAATEAAASSEARAPALSGQDRIALERELENMTAEVSEKYGTPAYAEPLFQRRKDRLYQRALAAGVM